MIVVRAVLTLLLVGGPVPFPAQGDDLVVRVVDEAGKGIAGSRIYAWFVDEFGHAPDSQPHGVSDENGMARLGLPDTQGARIERVDVRAKSTGAESMDIQWSGPLPDSELRIVLPRPAYVLSTLLWKDGTQLSGYIELDWELDEHVHGGTSVADGSHSTRIGPVAGRIVRARCHPYSGKEFVLRFEDWRIEPGSTVERQFVFAPPSDVEVLLCDASTGAPLPGVALDRYWKTDENGLVVFPRVATPQSEFVLDVRSDGYVPVHVSVAGAEDGSPVHRVVKLVPGSPFDGVVVDAEGIPGRDLKVRCHRMVGPEAPRRRASAQLVDETTTDIDGRFRFYGLPRGARLDLEFVRCVRVIDGGFQSTLGAAPIRTLDVSEPSRFKLPRGWHISGHVLTDTRQPVPQALVDAYGPLSGGNVSATSGNDGRFELDGCVPGEWYISASYPRSSKPMTMMLESGGRVEVEFVLPPEPHARKPAKLAVRCVDALTGRTLEPVDWIDIAGLEIPFAMSRVERGEVLQVLDEGEYEIRVMTEGFQPCALRTRVKRATEPTVLEIPLKRKP